ncbi:MAG TPA: biotin/lipoyl-containing protein [Parafilimonas sp.]|nr:biotin/lipoyl-containing protein [Parafilimonas sp.]
MPGKDETFIVKVNQFFFSVPPEKLESTDIIKKSDNEFHLIKDHQSIKGRVQEADLAGKKLRIEVDGEVFDVEIKDGLDQMLEKMGFDAGKEKRVPDIKAPMPGLVLKVFVTDGQQVKDGESILVLEAMKMENSILSQGDAKIKKTYVKSGQTVEKGQVLVELE